jgi:hypothetical protein
LANVCISGLLYVGIQRIAIDDYILRLSVVSVIYLFLIHVLNIIFHLNDTSLMFVKKLIRWNKP